MDTGTFSTSTQPLISNSSTYTAQPMPLKPIIKQPSREGNQRFDEIELLPVALNYSQGLGFLHASDQLLVEQLVGRFESLCGYEPRNRFNIMDKHGKKLYFAWEYTDACAAECCVSWRAFEMNVMDNDGNIVMRFKHPDFRYMEIEAPPDTLVGFIEREHCITPSFFVKNIEKQIVLYVEGPINTSNFRGNVDFEIFSPDGNIHVGKIRKQWSGLLKEFFTDADNFEISFPVGSSIAVKACLLGAVFMIDMMYYENNACPFIHI